MAPAGVSGVSGAAAGTTALDFDQLREYLLTWGIPGTRVQQRAERLAKLGVTLQGLVAAAAQPHLDVLVALLIDEGAQRTSVDALDACTIQAGATKAAAETRDSSRCARVCAAVGLVTAGLSAAGAPGAASGSSQEGAGGGAGAAAGATGGGQAATAAGAGSVMPQAEYLQRPMEEIAYNSGPTSWGSGTDMMVYQLSEWELDYADIQHVLATSLRGKTIASHTVRPWRRNVTVFTTEAETNDLFFHRACEWVNDVYAANGVALEWKLTPSSQQDNSRPDFVLRSPAAPSSADVMVGEGKFPSVLDQAELLAVVKKGRAAKERGRSRAPAGLRQSLGCAVEQECSYMEARRTRYGFLTCHRYTYFLKYLGFRHYAMTRAFLASATDPSVAVILYYLGEKSRDEGLVDVGGPSAAVPTVPAGGSSGAAVGRGPGGSSRDDKPPKVPRTQTAGPQQAGGTESREQRSANSHGSAACSSTPCMIPDGALTLGGRLGEGACGIVFLARLSGQEVALKSVDAYNSPHLILHLQHEAEVLSGRLQSLQGVCVPTLHACGYWRGRLMFVLAKSVIYGRHPEAGQENASAKASAEQALREIHDRGVAHGDIREENILVDDDDKVWFIDFGSSVLDPDEGRCMMELEELRLIFSAANSPDSDKTAHKHQ